MSYLLTPAPGVSDVSEVWGTNRLTHSPSLVSLSHPKPVLHIALDNIMKMGGGGGLWTDKKTDRKVNSPITTMMPPADFSGGVGVGLMKCNY